MTELARRAEDIEARRDALPQEIGLREGEAEVTRALAAAGR